MDNEKPSKDPQPCESSSTPHVSSNSSAMEVKLPQTPSPFAAYIRIFSYTRNHERLLQIVACTAALASGTAISLQALIFGDFITMMNEFVLGNTTPAKFRGNVSGLALYFVYLGIARFALSFTFNYLFTYTAHRVVRTIRYEFFRAALRQEIGHYDITGGGSIATQGASQGRSIQTGLSENLGMFLQAVAACIAAFAIAMSQQWKLTLICICIAPATLIIMGIVGSMQSAHQGKIMSTHMQASAFVEEVLGSMRTVHAYSIQQRLIQKYDGFLASAHQIGKKLSPLFGVLFSCQFTIFQLGLALGFWQGIRMIAGGEVANTGDVFIVLLSVILAANNLTSIAPLLVDFSNAGLSAVELFRLMDRQSLIDPLDSEGLVPKTVQGNLNFENIKFAYPTRPDVQVLPHFSLDIPAGKTTALVGPSGSGKSTIIGLLERWYSPSSGSIKLDGIPLDQLNLNWLRKSMRLVQQEPVLFQGTVFDNIRHGLMGTAWEHDSKEEQTERIHTATKQAFAHDFIMELPDGYDTFVGQRGGLLSGGQKQRIAIARSIVSDPKILLLDEATSALDPHAESVVQKALDRASLGRTTITIAHKLSTIQKADNIVVMSQGTIVEQGTHEQLLANGETYSRLVRIQGLNSFGEEAGKGKPDSVSGDSMADSSKQLEKACTRHSSSVVDDSDADVERYNYDRHKQIGMLFVFSRILKDNRKLSPVFLLVLAACLGGAAVYPGQAMLMARTVDIFTERDPSEMIRRGDFFASMFVVLAGGCLISYFVLGFATNIIAQEVSRRYRKQSLGDILRQDIQFFDREENSAGALSSRVDGYATNIIELTSFKIGLILISILNLLACSALALVYSWKLGLVVVFAGLPPLVASGCLKIRIEATQDRKNTQRYSKSASLASESITALRTVSSLAIERTMLQRYKDYLDEGVGGVKRPLCWVMLCFGFMQAVEFWFLALGFWYGCRLLSFNEVTMYNFMVAFLSVFLAGQGAGILFQFTTNVTAGLNGANYLFWLHGLEPAIRETTQNRNNGPEDDHTLQMSNLNFSYPSRPDIPVLRGASLTIRKGQFIGLVGASGSGKSTIIAILERFYDPVRGDIRIGSKLHTELSPIRYRSVMALVQQEPSLFTGTIRENVSYGVERIEASGDNEVDDTAIERALRAANAWDFTCSLPMGSNTSVGSSGTQLSGGQRQRIAIARALARNPRILLLDEATSALDTESERVVQDALNRAGEEDEGRTTVAIAHRLSTVKHADMICVFFCGRIIEMGTHDELLRRDGMYRKMCEAQALD